MREAGFWIRLGANLIDAIIIGIPLFVIASILTSGDDARDLFTNIVSAVYSLFVPVFWKGYTVGKRMCNIRIQKVYDEGPPTIVTMLLRNVVGGLFYGLTFGIGLIVSATMVAAREDKRAIHDFIAGTEVVYD